MDQDVLAIILKDTYSLNGLKHRLRILKDSLLHDFFGGDKEQISFSLNELNWLKSLPSETLAQINKDNVYKIFTDLETEIQKLPIATIYLAFEPDETTLKQTGSFARKTFNSPTLLLDVKLNPSLIGGAILAWKGMMRDYSVKQKLTQRKSELLQEFKKFLR